MSRQQRPITDREIKAWLAAGAVDPGVGEGLTFVASTIDVGRIRPPQSFSERCADQTGRRDAEGLSTLEERGLQAVQIDADAIT